MEIVGCEVYEAGSPFGFRQWVVHTITGYARDNAHGKGNNRSVRIICIDDNHEEYVEFPYSKGINKGDLLTVKYLPHSKYGILISVNNNNVALE